MSRIKRPKKASRLPTGATKIQETRHPSVCFYHLDESFVNLNRINANFFAQMIRKCKMLAGMDWDEIYRNPGIGWDEVHESSMKRKIPSTVERETLHHIKVSKKGRIWGYRDGNTFYVVWLDPNHEVTPER